jgi:hypothetical protein
MEKKPQEEAAVQRRQLQQGQRNQNSRFLESNHTMERKAGFGPNKNYLT